MAESTLSVAFADIEREVGRFLGWGRTSANWTADNTTDFSDILNSGLRRFYWPPPLEQGKPAYEWEFLKPTATITTANTDFDYDLADDFGGVILDDSVVHSLASGNRRIAKISASDLGALQAKDDQAGVPVYYAIRPKAFAPTTGHRFEMLLYPTPNSVATVSFRYPLIPDTITSSNKYPVGGTLHSETILEAVLAAAEEKMDNGPGSHSRRFAECLAASIRLDDEKKSTQPEI